MNARRKQLHVKRMAFLLLGMLLIYSFVVTTGALDVKKQDENILMESPSFQSSSRENVHKIPEHVASAQGQQTSIYWQFSDFDYDDQNDTAFIGIDIDLNSTNDETVEVVIDVYSLDTNGQISSLVSSINDTVILPSGQGYYFIEWRAVSDGDYLFNVTVTSDTQGYRYTEVKTWIGAKMFLPPPYSDYWYFSDMNGDGLPDTLRLDTKLFVNTTRGFWKNETTSTVNIRFQAVIMHRNETTNDTMTPWSYLTTVTRNITTSTFHGIAWDSWTWHAPMKGSYQFNISIEVNGSFFAQIYREWFGVGEYHHDVSPLPNGIGVSRQWFAKDLDNDGFADTVHASFELQSNTSLSVPIAMEVQVWTGVNGSGTLFETSWKSKTSTGNQLLFYFDWFSPITMDVWFNVTFYWNETDPFFSDVRVFQNMHQLSESVIDVNTQLLDKNYDGLNDSIDVNMLLLLAKDNKTGFILERPGHNTTVLAMVNISYFIEATATWQYLEQFTINYTTDKTHDLIFMEYQAPFNVSALRLDVTYFVNNTLLTTKRLEFQHVFWLPPITTFRNQIDMDGDGVDDTIDFTFYLRPDSNNFVFFSNITGMISNGTSIRHVQDNGVQLNATLLIDVFYLNATDPNMNQWIYMGTHKDHETFHVEFTSPIWMTQFTWSAPLVTTYRFNISLVVNGRVIDWTIHQWTAADQDDHANSDFWIEASWIMFRDNDLDDFPDEIIAAFTIRTRLPDSPIDTVLSINIYLINDTVSTNGTPVEIPILVDQIKRNVTLINGYAWELFDWQPPMQGNYRIELLLLNHNESRILTSFIYEWIDAHPPLFPNFWFYEYNYTMDMDDDSLADTAIIRYEAASNTTAALNLSVLVIIRDVASNQTIDQFTFSVYMEFQEGPNATASTQFEVSWHATQDGDFIIDVYMTHQDTGEAFRHRTYLFSNLHQYHEGGNTTVTTTPITSPTTTPTTTPTTSPVTSPSTTRTTTTTVPSNSTVTQNDTRSSTVPTVSTPSFTLITVFFGFLAGMMVILVKRHGKKP